MEYWSLKTQKDSIKRDGKKLNEDTKSIIVRGSSSGFLYIVGSPQSVIYFKITGKSCINVPSA
jgi:hypothetical protein